MPDTSRSRLPRRGRIWESGSGNKRACHGRTRETEEFLRLFQEAKSGNSSLILLTGRSGMGKTTLLSEVQHQLTDLGALVLDVQCRPGLPSYQPLAAAGREVLAHLVQHNTEHRLVSSWDQMLDVLQGRSLSVLSADHDPAAFRIRMFDRYAQMLAAASQIRPLVVLLNDLEFADPSSLDLVRYLGRVLTGRPELGAGSFRGLLVTSAQGERVLRRDGMYVDDVNLTAINLDALDADGIKDFLCSEEVLGQVLEVTGGVPRLLGRMLFAGRKETLQRSPLADLQHEEQQLLNLLAVAGRPLGPDMLHDLVDLSREQLTRAIGSLSKRRMVEKVVVEGEIRTGFSGAGEQEAVYDAMDPGLRCSLHAAMGDYLERLGDEELESCAEHLLKSGEQGGERAVEKAVTAGQRLEISCSLERAASLYEQALALTGDPALTLELTRKLSTMHEITGRVDRALQYAEMLRQQLPGDVEVELRIAHLHLLKYDHVSMREVLSGLQAKPERWQDDAVLPIRIKATTAQAMYLAGATEEATAACEQGLELCQNQEQRLAVALEQDRLRNILGIILLDRGDFHRAERLFTDNLDLARAMGRQPEELKALGQLGLTAMKRDDYGRAEAWYREARTMAEAMGEHRLLGICLQHLGVLEERRRSYARALELYQRSVAVLKKTGHRSYLCWVALDLGKLYLKLGDLSRADTMMELSARLNDADPPLARQINVLLLQGKIAQQRCRYREAARSISSALELAREAGHEERLARAQLDMANLSMERGEYRPALKLLGAPPTGGVLRVEGLLLRAQGELELDRPEAARVDLLEVLELNETLDDPEAAWQVRYLLSVAAEKLGRPAEQRRWIKDARSAEIASRAAVPAEYRQLLADQPLRAALLQSLRAAGAGARSIPRQPAQDQRWRKRYANIVGEHPRLMQILHHIDRVAPTDTTVLIRGESGTGKELVAQAIHARSQRVKKPLVAVNCGALVESLLLSELFGHERGAFTGASQRKKGRFEMADSGTIFLDEIGDISPRTQAALLRVLQEREFERVGGTSPLKVDVRIICATNRNLEEMVERGEFREDLYYRLRGVQLHLPSLRQRLEDVPLLADHFLQRISVQRDLPLPRLSVEAEQLLQTYRWPGNVRELENVLRSVSLLADSAVLDLDDFEEYPELASTAVQLREGGEQPQQALDLLSPAPASMSNYNRIRDEGLSLKQYKTQIEKECIKEALAEAGGNITRSAKLLGMKRPRLSQLIKEYGLTVTR